MHLSVASSRASHAPGSQQQPPSPALLARLADKKSEFEAVEALQRTGALFLRRLECLADDCDAMAEAGIGELSLLFYFNFLFNRRVLFCSAWPGARAVAADVSHLEYVL
jgi:hypothetical protein